MGETFVSLEQAAELEGISYKGMATRISRNPADFKTQTERPKGGGKDRVLVALSSLSKKARKLYKETLNVNGSDVVAEKVTGTEAPWYVGADLNWYIQNNSKAYYEAVELAKSMREFLNYGEADRTKFADEFAAKLGISQRTLYRYAKQYLEAAAWALKMGKEDGQNYEFFKILSLCRKPKEDNTFPSLAPQVRAMIENIFFDEGFASNAGTVKMLYGKLEQIAKEREWEIPSDKTVGRYITYLMVEKRAGNAHVLASKGLREFKRTREVKRSRNTGALPVMGLVQGDAHTFDCWVLYTHPNGKVTPIRPKMVAWIDTRSRVVMGDIMCKDPNAQIIKLSLLKLIYSYGVPQWLLKDNGKDYNAKALTGYNRKVRRIVKKAADKVAMSLDTEARGFFAGIGIQDDINSLPYQPWSKAQIERFFGTVCKMFTKWLYSYTGTLSGSKTTSKIKKDIPGMMKRGQLLTMEEFFELWTKWLNEVYHVRVHDGLKRQGEKWTKPIELFNNAEDRYFKAPPAKAYATILMMKAERVYVYPTGIKRFNHEYWAPELQTYVEDHVDIRYDPSDITSLFVYNLDGKLICEATSQELLEIAPRVSSKALEEHMKEKKQQLKNAKQDLTGYRTPYEEREALKELVAQHNRSREATGTIDVTIKGKSDKVVSLPDDKQYADDVKLLRKKEQQKESEFILERGKEALSKLRRLG